MGFLQSWKSRAKGLHEEDGAQRSNSVTLPRKPAFVVADSEADGRDNFVIKAGPSPRSPGAPPSSAPSRAIYRDGLRSASVAIGPTTAARACPPPAPPTKKLHPEYKTSAQFHHKVELNKGSISTVYKAQCTLTKGEIIIKQYIKQKMSPRAVHKMRREIRLMHMLESQPGVAQILGDFEDESFFYIIMEYCAGGDLYHRMIIKGQFDEHWACKKVIIPLLEVLHYIHTQAHIVHRDIKPENLFLTKGDELRLGDFGLAIKQDEELPFLRAGTLDYMAPEVLVNRVVDDFTEAPEVTASDLQLVGLRPYDEKVDVWAVGVLAFELLVGEAPFYNESEKETVKNIQNSNSIPFPARLRMSSWADFVRAALRKEPRQRPSALELLSHPWVQQHSAAPLFGGLGKAGPLARTGSLPCVALAGVASEAKLAQQAQQASVQIRVDATGGAAAATATGGVGPAPVTGSSGAGAAREGEDSAAPEARPPREAQCGAGSEVSGEAGAGEAGHGSCCLEVVDDGRVDKRVCLAELRRTRSTGEAAAVALTLKHQHLRQRSGSLRASRAGTASPPHSEAPTTAAAPEAGFGASAAWIVEESGRESAQGVAAAPIDAQAKEPIASTWEDAKKAVSQQAGGAAEVGGSADSPVYRDWDSSRAASRGSEVAVGDAVDEFQFAAEWALQESQLDRPAVLEGEVPTADAAPVASPATPRPLSATPSAYALLATAAPEDAGSAAGGRPATPTQAPAPAFLSGGGPLPPVVKETCSIASRPKSHSMPKSPYTAAKASLGAPVRGCEGADGAGAGAAQQSSTSAGKSAAGGKSPPGVKAAATWEGSKILAAWGKKPSRLSVAGGLTPASPTAPAAEGLPAGPPGSPVGPKALEGASSSRQAWSGSMTGSSAGSQEELRGTAKSGSINRLKLYLSRQRAA